MSNPAADKRKLFSVMNINLKKNLLLSFAILYLVPAMYARQIDYLQSCWNKHLGNLGNKYLNLTYKEELNELYHSPEPWQVVHYNVTGKFWCNAKGLLKVDTLISRKRALSSIVELDNERLLLKDYGSTTLSAVTKSMFNNMVFESARYTPQTIINYCKEHKISEDKNNNSHFAIYTATINNSIVRLFIRKADCLVEKVTTLSHDALRGDILSTFTYAGYGKAGGAVYPATIMIAKFGGRVKDTIRIANATLTDSLPKLLDTSAGYVMQESVEKQLDLHTLHYNQNIHFIDLVPSGSRVMIIEFKDFLLVSESPLSSETGEKILSEIRKNISTKPVRYFAFSHHHPDYIGGMRPYIYQGATVLCVPEDEGYVDFLYNSPHSLKPDSLQLAPKPLKKLAVKDSVSITDGSYSMNVYHIGMQSGHTKDYCVFYFPEEKLLVEGDLVWIANDGDLKKATASQSGLYHAIKDRNLNVETLIQTWGGSSGQYKMTIPFTELEKSALID
ncbi:MAG: MBL fold metallo-hydrolase [Chitinophagaceae bacterium]|jgi:glyoxylase-like metal-dependent hydrolase (beta-lactamase superfamily II)